VDETAQYRLSRKRVTCRIWRSTIAKTELQELTRTDNRSNTTWVFYSNQHCPLQTHQLDLADIHFDCCTIPMSITRHSNRELHLRSVKVDVSLATASWYHPNSLRTCHKQNKSGNKMLDRSPRRSFLNCRDRVGGGSVNIGVLPQGLRSCHATCFNPRCSNHGYFARPC